ncbi:MAG: alpha/beta hydrolase fold domain-containing protein [Solirubrobacteraceae bacterium]
MTGADMTLRFGALRVPTRVHWPRMHAGWLTLVLSDEVAATDDRVAASIIVVLSGAHSAVVGMAALRWLADHAEELGARPDRLLVAGGARAAWLALAARDSTGPVLRRQILVHPRFSPAVPMPTNVDGAPAATVVCGLDSYDDGRRYAARLRAAGIAVEEVRDGHRH